MFKKTIKKVCDTISDLQRLFSDKFEQGYKKLMAIHDDVKKININGNI